MSEAGGLEAEYQARVDDGGMVLEIIIENGDSAPPSLEDLQEWSDTYGLTMPVLADGGSGVLNTYATGSIGLPYMVLLDRGVVVDTLASGSFSQMDELLAE